MKKIIVVLLYSFILLFTNFTTVKTDTFAITEKTKTKEYIEINDQATTIEEKEEQKVIENEQEVIETENSDTIQTSEVEEYIEESTPVIESYYENYGTYGRLYVGGHSVALYDYNVNTHSGSSLQEIVNNDDSAAYYRNKGRLVIADHNYQGFSILGYLSEGDTAYIKFADGSTIGYRLIKKSKGYNTGPDLVDTEGNSFFNMYSDIIMYTCYDDGIMVTLWSL